MSKMPELIGEAILLKDKEILRLRAENEKLRTATTELLSHYYDAMRRDGYADEEVRSEHVFLAAAAALKETGDD